MAEADGQRVLTDNDTTEFVTRHRELLKKTFKFFDKSGNGVISAVELRDILRCLGMNPTEQEIADIMNAHDGSDTGRLEEAEFVQVMTEKLRLYDTESDILQVFTMFDKDRSGFIDARELRSMFDLVFGGMNDVTVQDMDDVIEELDKDGDGKLNYEEFMAMLLG